MIDSGQDILAQDIIAGNAHYAADAGSTDAYAISLPAAPGSYTDGLTIRFKANTANTGASTLNVNSLGAISIKRPDLTDTQSGDIIANQIVEVIYRSSAFYMVSPFATCKKIETDPTEVTVSSSTTETTLFDTTILGGLLKTNNAIRFEAFISTSGMANSGGETITFRLKYGATTIATCTITNPDAQVTGAGGFIRGYIIADNSESAQKGGFTIMLTDSATEDDNQAAVGISKIAGFGSGSASETSSADKTLTLTYQSSLNSASTNITAEFWVVEIVR